MVRKYFCDVCGNETNLSERVYVKRSLSTPDGEVYPERKYVVCDDCLSDKTVINIKNRLDTLDEGFGKIFKIGFKFG